MVIGGIYIIAHPLLPNTKQSCGILVCVAANCGYEASLLERLLSANLETNSESNFPGRSYARSLPWNQVCFHLVPFALVNAEESDAVIWYCSIL
jgi:hypothetical protein